MTFSNSLESCYAYPTLKKSGRVSLKDEGLIISLLDLNRRQNNLYKASSNPTLYDFCFILFEKIEYFGNSKLLCECSYI
jgi:hypothetical protein